MELARYKSLISDDSVLKLNEWAGKHFVTENKKMVIGFSFMHRGYPRTPFTDADRRILLAAFPFENLNVEIPLIQIGDEALIMVNSDRPEYAMTFALEVSEENGSAKVKLHERPLMGTSIITEEEIEGLVCMADKR